MTAFFRRLLIRWKSLSSTWQTAIFGAVVGILLTSAQLAPAISVILLILLVGIVLFALSESFAETHPIEPPGPEEILTRTGRALSKQIAPEHIDNWHSYQLIERTDLLDYSGGDFYSIRRLQGKNVSSENSTFLPYVESSERRCSFFDTRIRAYSFQTREELKIESFKPGHDKRIQHAFKIFFPSPLAPGETFDIVFAMRLPEELHDLSDEDEGMSISLGRMPKGVEELRFHVCLNFKPRTVFGESDWKDKQNRPCDATVSGATPYTPTEWYEKELGIEWTSTPYKVTLISKWPKAILYAIRYKR